MQFPTILPASIRDELASHDPRWRSKILIQVLTINFALISLILFAIAIPMWNANFFHARGLSKGDWTDGMPLAPLAITVLFCAISITNTFVRQRVFPPLASIIVWTLVLLTLLISIVFAGVGSMLPHWQPEPDQARSSSGTTICNALNMFSRNCDPAMYRIGELQIGGLIFGVLTWLSIIFLFVVSIQEWRDLKAIRKGRLPRKLTLSSATASDLEKWMAPPVSQRLSYGHGQRRSSTRLSTFNRLSSRPLSLPRPRFSRGPRYSVSRQLSTSTTGDTVPFVFVVAESEPSYPPPIRQR